MRNRLRHRGFRIASARRGAAALEFAIAASAFLGTVVFVFDLGFVLYTQVALDFVASRTARLLSVDSTQKLSANQAIFQTTTVCPLISSFIGCGGIAVALQPVTDFSSVSVPSSGPLPFNPGSGGSLMMLQLSYRLPTFAAPLAPSGLFAAQTISRFPFVNEY